MVSGYDLIAKPHQLTTSVLAAHADMRIAKTDPKGIREPAIGILASHDSCLPNAIKFPMCLDPQIS